MTSSSNVVRSLSADELASSLPRAERPQNSSVEPASTTAPTEEHKSKTGLKERFRRAWRWNVQSLRSSSRPEKATRNPLPSANTRHGRSTASAYAGRPSGESERSGVAESPKAAINGTNSESGIGGLRKHPPGGKSQPASPTKSAPRARTWRGGISSRSLTTERPSPELGDSKSDSRRFMSLRGNDSNKKSNGASFLGAPSRSDDGTLMPGSPNSQGSALRPNSHRSLPKRVFSSPPSLTGRSFNFGARKRGSVSGKNAPPRAGTYSSDLSEGDSDSVKKLNKSMAARSGLYDGRGSMNFAAGNNMAAFAVVVEGATSGRITFVALLDAMFRLEERLTPAVKEMLIKYLGRQENMEALIDHLTVVVPAIGDDEGIEGPGGERERYRYSYVSSMLLSNGPIMLRRSLYFNHKNLDRLVRVLGHGTPTDPVVVRSVCKVLLSVLRDSPEDTVRAMQRRKDFIDALLSHIAVTGCPEVCLSMLSTVRCQAELKFEPSNKPVVGMMADSRLVETLCDKLANAAENSPLDGTSSSTIENCSRVIVGIALRALVIPRFDVREDDSNSSDAKFNMDLSSLDVFSQPAPILRLLDSGLKALDGHDTRGYALSTALTAVRYLLVTALNGQDSSLSTIRMQLLTVNTTSYEAGIRHRIPKMAKVLEHARDGVVVETMWNKVKNPLGVVRLKILELVVVLLQHCGEATAQAIGEAEIPRILLDLFVRLKLNSLLQHFVAAIIELSFTGKFSCLRRSFLIDVRLLDRVMDLWNADAEEGDERKREPVNYAGELVRIVCAVHEFLKRDTAEVRELKREVGSDCLETFQLFCEGPIANKLKDSGALMCGPGELPPRPMDNFNIDGGYGSVGGSQGSLFLRSRGSNQT